MKKIIVFLFVANLHAAFPSWYYKINNTKHQKKAFVKILLPLIQIENQKIKKLRKKIIDIFNDSFYLIHKKKIAFLLQIIKDYKIKKINKSELLKKIDIIPPSLALSQAAIESGWGKSRFAKEANNTFGHWVYSNKGLKPKSRYDHIVKNYSIRIFSSLEESIKAYMKNLNTNLAYKNFRELRYKYRKSSKKFTGLVAAETMINYSQKRKKYVKLLKKLIKSYNWERYD